MLYEEAEPMGKELPEAIVEIWNIVLSCREWMLLSVYKCRTKFGLYDWQIRYDERGMPDEE